MTQPTQNSFLAIGLMSGTSFDGIDATLIRSDGQEAIDIVADFYMSYEESFISKLRTVLTMSNVNVEALAQLQYELTLCHISAVKKLLAKASTTAEEVAVIGFHGQTIYHNPILATSWQLGLPELLACHTQIDVVYNFRARDVALGGQGAPLVPLFHKVMLQKARVKHAAILNIGGISNITFIDQDEEIILAGDIGPGNQLINDLTYKLFAKNYDNNGEIAASSTPDEDVMQLILKDDFFARSLPKSLDRSYFTKYLPQFTTLAPKVQVATATHLTARAIALAIMNLQERPEIIYCAGGGAANSYLMQLLSSLLAKYNIAVADVRTLGFDRNFVESSAFAYLALRSKLGLVSTYPSTTGVKHPVIAGNLIRP